MKHLKILKRNNAYKYTTDGRYIMFKTMLVSCQGGGGLNLSRDVPTDQGLKHGHPHKRLNLVQCGPREKEKKKKPGSALDRAAFPVPRFECGTGRGSQGRGRGDFAKDLQSSSGCGSGQIIPTYLPTSLSIYLHR
jgi:hypothetical protein